MTAFVYCLGLLLCCCSGFIDRNPSAWRFIGVTLFFGAGIVLMIFSNKFIV
jgi:hypothetical protein